MGRPLQRLALLGLASLATAAADVTCVDKASDQTTYTAAGGAQYKVECGIDYAGGDIAATQTPTFAACIDACDSTPSCIDVSYAGNTCYMKNKLGDGLARDWVWTAKQITSSSGHPLLTCVDRAADQALYTSATGAVFQILCGRDYAGGDVAAKNTDTFAECIDACASTADCADVSYAGNACYMKRQSEDFVERDWVWTAKLVQSSTGGGGGGASEDTALSCDSNKSDGIVFTAANSDFEITCFKDYAGGDLLGLSTNSFEECIQACDAHSDCVNVAYVHGGCYLKGEQKPAVDNNAVWGAVRKSKSDSATSSASATESAPASTTTSATPASTQTPLNCGDGKPSNGKRYQAPSGGLYQILCGVDYGGGDLTATTTESFEDCIAACDANKDCIDVSFVAPACYLKNQLNDADETKYFVWTAKQLRAPGSVFTFPTVTPMDPGSGTETDDFSEPIELEAAPIATLGPVPPPGVNMAGTGVLTPDPVSELWYNGTQSDSDGSDLGPVTVRLNITYAYPSIVLDHSIFIKDVVCEAGTLHGRFNTSYPYYFSEANWPTDDDVLLITSADSCGDDAAQNAFFLAHTISFTEDSLSFEALGQIVQLSDVFADLTVDFGNITVADAPQDEQQDVCGTPSADTLHGLPAVPCGTNFDQVLDDKLGYYSSAGGDAEAVLALATPASAAEVEVSIQKRGWFSNLFKAVAKAVVTVVKVVAQVVVAVAQTVVAVVKKAVDFVVNTAVAVAKVTVALAVNAVKLVAFAVTGQYSNSLTLPLALGPPATVEVDSPWGKAFKMYTFKMGEEDEKFSATKATLDNLVEEFVGAPNPEPGVEIYCVNCGVRGSVKATGKINATPLSGVKEASIGISGNLYVGMYLGVNAFAKWEKEWEKELFSKGLPGWSIPGIVTLGPKLILSAKATVSVEAEGQILTGASLTWPGFEATLDMVNPSKSSKSGWTPNIDHAFQVHGGVTATAAVGLPVSLWFGIDILNGVFKKGAALVDTPALTGTAEFEVNAGTEETSVGTDECLGIAWDITLTNEVSFEIDDGPEWTLFEWASPALAEGCIGWEQPQPDPIPDVPELPADDGSLKCPAANGQVYTDDRGNQWQIRCNYDYMYYDTAQTWSNSMEECMSWCAGQGNCAGVSYGSDEWNPTINCWARSRAGPSRQGPYHSMMLMSPFEILSVVYGTADITNYAIQNWQVGNRIEINTDTASQSTSVDRNPGQPKSIFMLYRYGAETRSWVGAQSRGIVTIYPGPVSSAPGSSMLVPDYPQEVSWIKVVEVCYGLSQIRNQNVFHTLYMNSQNRQSTGIENDLFGDPWYGILKSAVIWYRDTRYSADGPLYMITGIEHEQFKLMRADGSFNKRLIGEGEGGGGGGGGYIPPTETSTTLATSTTAAPAPEEPTTTTSPADAAETSTTVTEAPESSTTTEAPSSSSATTASETTSSTSAEATPEPSLGLATVRDTTGALELQAGNNGNLFLSAIGSTSTSDLAVLTNGTTLAALTLPDTDTDTYLIPGDSADRLLHYFPDEVAQLGASRLRLATWDKLPVGSKLINLVPVKAESGTGEEMLVAVAADGSYLWPVMCAIEGQVNKVFLVRENDDAAIKAALEAEDAKFVLTGGQASKCGVVALVAQVEAVEVPAPPVQVIEGGDAPAY